MAPSPYRSSGSASSTIVFNWPLAVVLTVATICGTILCVAHVIPEAVVTHLLVLLVGVAFPSQPLLTRFRTVYSIAPPPMSVEADRPDPVPRNDT